jgi:transcriptional regulator with XRE-family HTH domain
VLGKRIRELRAERGMSLRQLARRLGVSAAYVSDVELGRRLPSDKLLAAICGELGVGLGELRQHDIRLLFRSLRQRAELDSEFLFSLQLLLDGKVQAEDVLKLCAASPEKVSSEIKA